jgi:hypothetical protein
MPIKVLSVDWDWFFPDPTWYDWGSHEDRELFYELIWVTRTNTKDRNGKNNACEIFNPDPEVIKTFWNKVVKPRPMHICVTESHRDIYGLLRELRGIELINLDAHHDYGYQQTKVLDCSNWAYHGVKKKIISKYKLYYPEWRKGHEEEGSKKCEVHYGLPPKSEYDVVFICRSPSWTPPWADEQWLKLVTGLQAIPGTIDKKYGNPRAYCPRNMSLAQAREFAQQYDDMTKKLLEVNSEKSHSPVKQVG